MSTLRVRLADAADAAAFAQVHVAAWQCAYRGLIADATLDALDLGTVEAKWRRIISGPAAGTRITVCELGGRVMAWSTHGPRRDSDRRDGEVHGLYAHPDAWGRGLGSALLTDALRYLDGDAGFPSSVVWVLSGNARARGCYERHGFRVVRDRVPLGSHPETTQALMRRDRP